MKNFYVSNGIDQWQYMFKILKKNGYHPFYLYNDTKTPVLKNCLIVKLNIFFIIQKFYSKFIHFLF